MPHAAPTDLTRALILMVRDREVPAGLALFMETATALEARAMTGPGCLLWWVAARYIRRLAATDTLVSRDDKRTLARLERAIAMHADTGEAALSGPQSENLVRVLSPVVAGEPDFGDMEIFLEEAGRQVEAAHTALQAARAGQPDAMTRLGGSLETLVSAADRAGVARLGAFAASAEELAQALATCRIEVDETALSVLSECVATLPALMEEVEVGSGPGIEVERLLARALATARGVGVSGGETGGESAALMHATQVVQERAGSWLRALDESRATGAVPGPVLDALVEFVRTAESLGRPEAAEGKSLQAWLMSVVEMDELGAASLRERLARLSPCPPSGTG